MNSTVLYLVVPCYNEQDVIRETNDKLLKKLKSMTADGIISGQSGILYVDDGSQDCTWKYIREFALAAKNSIGGGISGSISGGNVKGIKFSRNEGHQNALMAGMTYIHNIADIVITIDADLQQDIEVLDQFVRKYEEGNDIVFGIRNSRNTDNWLKKFSASLFYKIMMILGTRTIPNHADYRLISSRALDNLLEYKETQLFLRGLVADLGFRTAEVYFDVKPRAAGESKYTIRKMIRLAMNGITSLSIKPLHFVFDLGVAAIIISVLMIIYNIKMWIKGAVVQGWTSILCSVWMIGGVVLVGMGIIGEYLGKLYLEEKKRPLYFIEEEVGTEE